MPDRRARYWSRIGEALRRWREGPCEVCGKRTLPRELAHVGLTGLNGRGRGQDRRYSDLRCYPDAYARLCTRRHGRLDMGPMPGSRAAMGLGPAEWYEQGVGKPGNPPSLELGDRRFKSSHPDHFWGGKASGEPLVCETSEAGSTPAPPSIL